MAQVGMKVYDCLLKIKAHLGYVHIITIAENGGIAKDRTLETLRTDELVDLLQTEGATYYQIGEYWYIIITKPENK